MADALASNGTLNQHDVIDKRLESDALGITDHISNLLCTHVKRAVIAAADGVRATLEVGAGLQ